MSEPKLRIHFRTTAMHTQDTSGKTDNYNEKNEMWIELFNYNWGLFIHNFQ